MITSETPYKLAEIIRDTWPNLYKMNNLNYDNDNIKIKKNLSCPEKRKYL